MRTNIYFIRHAEPDYSVHDDEMRPLTKKGESDACKVADYFEDKNIDRVMSSPYKRAVDTIKPYADKNNLEIKIINGFRERKISNAWIEDFKAYTQKQWADFEYKLSDGESLNDVQSRNIEALKRVVENNIGKNIIIGSHGTALSTIINYYDGSYGYADFDRIRAMMPWIVKFTFNECTLESIERVRKFAVDDTMAIIKI